jgi:hypothetical protein
MELHFSGSEGGDPSQPHQWLTQPLEASHERRQGHLPPNDSNAEPPARASTSVRLPQRLGNELLRKSMASLRLGRLEFLESVEEMPVALHARLLQSDSERLLRGTVHCGASGMRQALYGEYLFRERTASL